MNKRNLTLSLGAIALGAVVAFTFVSQTSGDEVTSETAVNVENAETSTEAQVEKVTTPATPQTAEEENAVNSQTGETTNEPTVVSPNESE